jgi:hypothetical protein
MRARHFALAGTVALALSLTGCSNPLGDLADKAVEGVVENNADEVIEGLTGGDIDFEFDSVPEDFPSEVPLVSTDVVQSLKIAEDDGTIFSVTVADERDPATVAQDVKADFAGWEETFSQEAAGMIMYQFSQTSLQVGVNIAEGDSAGLGGSIAQYTVSVAG